MAYPNKYTDAQVEILGELGKAHKLGATSASNRLTDLSPTTKRVSIKAVGTDMRFAFGDSSVNATDTTNTTTSHYIADGERLDLACPEGTYIAVKTVLSIGASGDLYITELV